MFLVLEVMPLGCCHSYSSPACFISIRANLIITHLRRPGLPVFLRFIAAPSPPSATPQAAVRAGTIYRSAHLTQIRSLPRVLPYSWPAAQFPMPYIPPYQVLRQ